MAEGFRKYVMDRDSRTLGQKILDFFKNLLIKTTNWKHVTPHLTVYYRMINEGKYANRTDSISSIKDLRNEDNIKYRKDVDNNREVNNLNFNTLDSETLKALKDKKWTEEMWNSVSQIEREQAIKCISF